MKFWQSDTAKYFNLIVGLFVFIMMVFILYDSMQARQTRASLVGHMENLREVIFMSTYDSLQKGNMPQFRNILEEIGTYDDVLEYSLIGKDGVVRYSSDPGRVKEVDRSVVGLGEPRLMEEGGEATYIQPVETTLYCSRCHLDWPVGSVNSYYKLTLSRAAIENFDQNTNKNHSLMVLGGLMFIAFLSFGALYYERKKNEDQMLVTDSVRNFMDSVEDPFMSVNLAGQCTFCNLAGLELLGYERERQLVGRDIHEMIQHTGSDGSPVPEKEKLLNRMLIAGKTVVLDELLLWRADGSYFVAECRLHPIFKQGKIAGATLTLMDVTRKKAEELRTIKLSHLATMGELAAGVAHEINNPIGGVINYAQLYKNRYKPDKQGQELLDRIIKEGQRIASIVYSLLNYAHQGAQKYEPVNFIDVVSETMNLFQARLDREGIILDINIDEQIPLVMGNFQNLEQVLMNLISNARYALNKKYPERDNIDKILRVVVEDCSDDEWPHLRVTVYDQGCGIPQAMLDKVMTPFITTKPAGEGTGLGLHVCFNIINQHEGRIDIESEADHFTMVRISLPVIE